MDGDCWTLSPCAAKGGHPKLLVPVPLPGNLRWIHQVTMFHQGTTLRHFHNYIFIIRSIWLWRLRRELLLKSLADFAMTLPDIPDLQAGSPAVHQLMSLKGQIMYQRQSSKRYGRMDWRWDIAESKQLDLGCNHDWLRWCRNCKKAKATPDIVFHILVVWSKLCIYRCFI